MHESVRINIPRNPEKAEDTAPDPDDFHYVLYIFEPGGQFYGEPEIPDE